MWILLVTYKSGLPIAEVLQLFERRSDNYRKVKGLVQKLYFHDESSGHVGGVYIFDSKENLESFQASDLAKGIGDAYKFTEPPTKRILKVTNILHQNKNHLI